MSFEPVDHTTIVLQQWGELKHLLTTPDAQIEVDGGNLSFARIIYVARYKGKIQIGREVNTKLHRSIDALSSLVDLGGIIYGVNTGFGSAADNRTTQREAIQRTLTRELSYGILSPGSRDHPTGDGSALLRRAAYDLTDDNHRQQYHLPWSWVRTAILMRVNTLAQGYSAVRPAVVDCMRSVLNHDVVPMIPLRGSISASGDLNPLAYIAGVVQGKATIRVLTKDHKDVYADEALARENIEPISLQMKEGLAMVNGTAISASAGLSALYDAHSLVMLAQILSAMSVECLLGTDESFHPFLGLSRPHPGQIECARNIRSFLAGSKLVLQNDGADKVLRQDRYSIRTVPQWLGPAIEDINLAHQQIVIECNSATDNPLVDPDGSVIHGGNFQAKAVTSAMEKTRQVLQTIGRMLFSQVSEMINPITSRGLPPDLVIEDPTASGIFRSTDIHLPALVSELTFLASPVNSVMTAERGNQSLNSLALVSARYTNTSVEVLTELAAAHILAGCQALDLRAFHFDFLETYKPVFCKDITSILMKHLPGVTVTHTQLQADLWREFIRLLDTTVQLDHEERFQQISQSLRLPLLGSELLRLASDPGKLLDDFASSLRTSLLQIWTLQRDAWINHGDASRYLGYASRILYRFVRQDLGVPFLCTDRIRTPSASELFSEAERRAPTVGQYTAAIYRAIRNGTMAMVMLEIVEGAGKEEL